MKTANTAGELAAILPTATWYTKLTAQIVDDFVCTVTYAEGHLAHMQHDEIQAHLNKDEFDEFLAIVGVSQETFLKYNGRFCTGGPQYRYCAEGNGLCDPSYCHAN
jgi:hypothetical protein